jgi:flagellar biosynthesis chaperone FliJ
MDETAFAQALDLYRSNYLEYKMSGNTANKIAYERAQAVMDQYLQQLQTKIGNDASYVDKFVQEYANSNEKLMTLRDRSQAIQKEGPVLQDIYEVRKRLSESEEEPVDYTGYYVKGAVIVGLVGIAYVASALR